MTNFGLTKDTMILQVKEGLDELHSIGLAHCDISVSNVLIDDNGVVFLDDLEYLTPINNPAPHHTRLPVGATAEQVENAQRLDDFQFQVFKTEVYCMQTIKQMLQIWRVLCPRWNARELANLF